MEQLDDRDDEQTQRKRRVRDAARHIADTAASVTKDAAERKAEAQRRDAVNLDKSD